MSLLAEVLPENVSDNAGESEQPNWALLVDKIRHDDQRALEELYRIFSRGMRYYLCRQLGPQDLDDRVHDSFLIVVQAIRRGDLREPERLMGFARTIVRRQIAGHIDIAVQQRKQQVDLDTSAPLPDSGVSPETAAMTREEEALAVSVLKGISRRDREILTRFYLEEQTQEEICRDMSLSETQFRLLKSRAKARFGELGKRKLSRKTLGFFENNFEMSFGRPGLPMHIRAGSPQQYWSPHMRNFEQHSTEESLELYALGQLDEGESELLEEHILICEDCCARLDGADRYVRAMRSGAARLRREEKPKSSSAHGRTIVDWFRMPLPAWGAVAAVLCAAVVLTTTQIHRQVPADMPVAAALVAERGEAPSFPAHRRLNLTLDAKGLNLGPKTRVELVDSNGRVIEEETVPETDQTIKTTTREGLESGAYYVRLYSPGATDPLREYSLAVQ